MKNLLWLVMLALICGCGKSPQGLLGKCEQDVPGVTYPGQKYCSDYSFVTPSSKDLTSEARASARASCGGGTWADNEACSTTLGTMTGFCKFSIEKTSGAETYTLSYRAVFGPMFLAATNELRSWCEGLNQPPLSATWSMTP